MATAPFTHETPRGRDPPYPDSLLVDSGQDPNARPPCTPSVESVLRYRHELIERFRNIVCSSATLPPYADDLIGSIHAFVLAHQYPAPTALVADTGYIAPWKLLSDPAPVIDDQQAEEDGGRADVCRFGNCKEVLTDLTVGGVTEHLLRCHFGDRRSDWQKADKPVQCLWPHCRHRGMLKKRSLAKHICTTHLKITEVRCGIPGCDAVLSRSDGRERHVAKVHGLSGTDRESSS
ncbi:hypothetical protein C8Q72DRAFT_858493 [Fomitopsis betulina]|nr:hypothetical protein C8Q72DRAFT_858493 [Fomitopsis betulina]